MEPGPQPEVRISRETEGDLRVYFLRCQFEDEDDAENEELLIVSSEAFVAATTLSCHRCRATIEVICIHYATGTVSEEPLTQFTVSDIWAMDDALARQLAPWPTFRRA